MSSTNETKKARAQLLLDINEKQFSGEKIVSGTRVAWTKDDNSPVVIVRGVTTVKADARDVKQKLIPVDEPAWQKMMKIQDSHFEEGNIIDDTNAQGELIRRSVAKFNSGFPGIAPRQFYWSEEFLDLEDGTFIDLCLHLQPTEMASHPPNPACVLAHMLVSGFIVRPIRTQTTPGVSECELTYIIQADPCGWLPTAVTNLIACDQALVAARVRDAIEAKLV
eukprot:c5988_g1_i2.p1 GENE.c5988_g1_i2~~c5988_g1_i2.p1  ORF type:complete len:232 (+),score=72.18 c5988_g1_i2:32-697(+)